MSKHLLAPKNVFAYDSCASFLRYFPTFSMSNTPQSRQNIWFSVSLGLFGIIIGYSAATVGGRLPVRAPEVQDPTPQVVSSAAPTASVPGVSNDDHVRGNKDARLSFITYSDYDCPFSKRHHPTLAQILDAYGNDVNIVYRHFPLEQLHPDAKKKAEAAECVAAVGGNDLFWQFTDALYDDTKPQGVALSDIQGIVKGLGVDEQRFTECYDGGTYADAIDTQVQEGAGGGITGTPGNVLLDNRTKKSQLLTGARPFETFKAAIDEALAN